MENSDLGLENTDVLCQDFSVSTYVNFNGQDAYINICRLVGWWSFLEIKIIVFIFIKSNEKNQMHIKLFN